MADSKWKWTSIATVPDLCPTTITILTHLISRYHLPLMVAFKIRIFVSSRLRGLVNNTITSTSRQGGPDPPAGASRRHAPLQAAGPSLPHRPDPVQLVGPSPPHRPDPVQLVGPSPPCRPATVPLLLTGPAGRVGGSSSSRILTSPISPTFPGKRQGSRISEPDLSSMILIRIKNFPT